MTAPPEEVQATAIGNMHKNLGKTGLTGRTVPKGMFADRQTDIQTKTLTRSS